MLQALSWLSVPISGGVGSSWLGRYPWGAIGLPSSGQADVVKGADYPPELFVTSLITGQLLGPGEEVRLPFITPGVLKVVVRDPKAHC